MSVQSPLSPEAKAQKNVKPRTHRFVDAVSDIVSSKVFFTGFIVFTLGWMTLQFFLKHPVDDPHAFFPFTILIYTLVGLWIENLMKVYQKEQQDLAARQLEALHKLIEVNVHETQSVGDLVEASKLRDEQTQALIIAACETINKVLDALEPDGE